MTRIAWTVMVLAASLVAAYAVAVLFVPGSGAPFVGALRTSAPLPLYAHLAGGAVALAAGPWQFSGRLRARALSLHRWFGRLYVTSVAVGGAGGVMLARTSQAGLVTHVGFALLAILWVAWTLQAYRAIRRGDVEAHRAWMTRSFALTLAAVTLRIVLPLEIAAGIPFHDAYQVVSWACWVPNLIAAEWLVARMSSRAASRRAPAAASVI